MTVDLDNWVISQSHRCKVVFPAIELSYSDISLPYNPSLGSQVIYPSSEFFSWDEFFGNTDSENCPITSCQIFEAGDCGNDPLTSSSNFEIEETYPWDIEASLTVSAGYIESICV